AVEVAIGHEGSQEATPKELPCGGVVLALRIHRVVGRVDHADAKGSAGGWGRRARCDGAAALTSDEQRDREADQRPAHGRTIRLRSFRVYASAGPSFPSAS